MTEHHKFSAGKDFNQNGVHNRTHAFIVDAISVGAHQVLTADQRNILMMYFGTPATFFELAHLFLPHQGGVKYSTTLDRVSAFTRHSLEALWEKLPEDKKTVYPFRDVILMKGQEIYKDAQRQKRQSPFPAPILK